MYPFIEIFSLRIPTYGLMMLAGMAVCVLLSMYRAKRYSYSSDDIILIAACIIGIAIVGAKLLYIIVTYSFNDIINSIKSGSFEFLTDGGLVFYGGLIGGVIGAFLGFKLAGVKPNNYILLILPTIPLGHALGRVGCLLAGCCYGVPYDGFGSVVYHNPIGGAPTDIPLFPVQGLEALCNLLIFVVLVQVSKRSTSGAKLIMVYAGLYSVVRFALEYLRYDAIRGGALTFSTSQWISIVIVALIVITLPFLKRFTKRND